MPSAAEELLLRVEWTVLRRLDGLLQGEFRSPRRGQGLELADLRAYRPGDDVRRIDWNATARLQQATVREDLEERALSVWFLVDQSGSLDFGSGVRKKSSLALECVALLARLLGRHGNRVGAIRCDGRETDWMPAVGGRSQVVHILTRLMAARSRPAVRASPRSQRNWVPRRAVTLPVSDDHARARSGELELLLNGAERWIRHRGLVVVLSDFLDAGSAVDRRVHAPWASALHRLARRHDVLVLRLWDPVEWDLPDLGEVVLQDIETGEQLRVDTADAEFRRRYRSAAERHEDSLRTLFARAGVDACAIATDEDPAAALLNFARQRRLSAGVPGGR